MLLSISSVEVIYGKFESLLDVPKNVKQLFSTQQQGFNAAKEVLSGKVLNDQ